MSTADTEEKYDNLLVQSDHYKDEDGGIFADQWNMSLERHQRSPEVTLSAFSETGQEESTIPVWRQRSYTGRMVISSALANTPCADLGITGVLEKLNATLGTSDSYTLDRYPILNSFLDSCIEQNYDFGTVYAHFRYCSSWDFIATIEDKVCEGKVEDRKMRREVLLDGRISKKNVPPRRVWDLFANRVVPYWVGCLHPSTLSAISHAWMDAKDREDVWTGINGYQWPVPMPKDADLNLVRIEMLNIGAEFAWLDVLCLRQKYDVREDHLEEDRCREDLRVEEWKLDVPTIGYVYGDCRPVVYYLSGLGRPLRLTPGFFDSDRCWFNRAWTLQEIGPRYRMIIAGDTGDKNVQAMFRKRLTSIRFMDAAGASLSQMRKRVSTNPIDKVAGLVYRLDPRYIPVYDAMQSEESAWIELVNAMTYSSRARLLFGCPEPGNGSKCWRPSWTQVMDASLLDHFPSGGQVGRTEETDIDWYEGPCIENAYVRGLADTTNKQSRSGDFTVTDHSGVLHTIEIHANHKYPIPDDSYTLLYPGYHYINYTSCVIGRRGQDRKFQKLSVVEMSCALWGNNMKEMRELS
ncbi:hypothetical protein ARMSODRAFT_920924 [Armillaria solidipes]|uniref:Heterokaryon incompatibility domain-containing protein n=1 Tax=Armillaria solidipes TaxID=1076256 RepID=A0A2H3ASI8_9AGAR|nr:hypothetical protein ARMSODRAFT_920924 [Armillaria solidipes]